MFSLPENATVLASGLFTLENQKLQLQSVGQNEIAFFFSSPVLTNLMHDSCFSVSNKPCHGFFHFKFHVFMKPSTRGPTLGCSGFIWICQIRDSTLLHVASIQTFQKLSYYLLMYLAYRNGKIMFLSRDWKGS